MKTGLSVVTALFISVTLSSCFLEKMANQNVELVPVIINNEYSLDIPEYMTKTTSLNDVASLQFQNVFREAYVIVIDENKQEFVDVLIGMDQYDSAAKIVSSYADTQFQSVSSGVEVLGSKAPRNVKINGLSAVMMELDAKVEGVNFPVTYFMTFLESRKKLYMIMAWTLQDKKDTHRETFEKMIKTFKTIKHR